MADIRFKIRSSRLNVPCVPRASPQTPTAVSLVAVFLISRPEYWTIIAQVDADIGNVNDAGARHSGGNSHPDDHCYPADDLWALAGCGRSASAAATHEATSLECRGLNNHGWIAGASFNYEIWRNLMLTLDYQYTTVQSDAAFSDFTRNRYTAGLTYRY